MNHSKETNIPDDYDYDYEKEFFDDLREQLDYDFDDEFEYVSLSTSGDESVCPICRQFDEKFFLRSEAPKLPLCPNCNCAYMYYRKEDLPKGVVISSKDSFVLPAECVKSFYVHQRALRETSDINKKIELCEDDLKKLAELMVPYLAAKFPAPADLACRDLLPEYYMRLGKWCDAERVIKGCIEAKAYYPHDGAKQLADFKSCYQVAMGALFYISENPGCLQRDIYKKLPYEGTQKDQLKHFMRYSTQIIKEKSGSTYKLYVK